MKAGTLPAAGGLGGPTFNTQSLRANDPGDVTSVSELMAAGMGGSTAIVGGCLAVGSVLRRRSTTA